jgi:hypothetical protein
LHPCRDDARARNAVQIFLLKAAATKGMEHFAKL